MCANELVKFNKNTTTGNLDIYINGVLRGNQTFDTATYGQWSNAGTYIGYNIIDIVARNNNYSVDDTDLVILLFQLLDSEDERIIPRLYTALGGLRLAHQSNLSVFS